MSTCATASRVAAEPLFATAATARTWLLVEQPGPWGAKALTGSHLDPVLGRALEEAASPHGVRVALIRRPGPHADRGGPTRRRVYLAHTLPGRSWVRTAQMACDPEALLGLDFAALGEGRPPYGPAGVTWEPHRGDPLVMVCTNGKLDRCCALLGRPLAAELAASAAADVWEITHIGGHRFAPTLLVLPHGYAYGRVGSPAVKSVVEAVRRGRVATEGCRGRSAWSRPGQAADLAVRSRTGERRADALDVLEPEQTGDASWTVIVVHTDGRRWRVCVSTRRDSGAAPVRCGADPEVPVRMHVDCVDEVVLAVPGRAGPPSP